MLKQEDKKMDRQEIFYKKGQSQMNSIVQEAPSIAKAIELAWAKAGEPQKFSIRIYEHPEKNFFGMVKKQAKISLLFEKRDIRAKTTSTKKTEFTKRQPSPQPKRSTQPERKTHTQPKPPASQKKSVKPKTPAQQPKPQVAKKTEPKKGPAKQIWSPEMIATAENWMKSMLGTIGKKNIQFSVEAKRYHLKFLLEEPVAQTEEKQKAIFRNCAHLIMQTVRNKSKKQFRYHKVVISSATK